MRGDKESGMRILSVTAQKPCSTGSGVYLTEVVKALAKEGHTQTVLAGPPYNNPVVWFAKDF